MDFPAEHGYREGKNVVYHYANAQGDRRRIRCLGVGTSKL
jgi:hypothetical protein